VTDAGYGAQTGVSDVTVMLEFRTDEASNLETQLPAGRVRLYQNDVDGSPLLVGEDQIDHTPKNETVRLTVGNAFDIVGERVQTNYKPLGDSGAEESFRITLRNHKEEAVEVRVVENLYRWTQWSMVSRNAGWQAGGAHPAQQPAGRVARHPCRPAARRCWSIRCSIGGSRWYQASGTPSVRRLSSNLRSWSGLLASARLVWLGIS
jgi:hypothetical protein